MKFLITLTILFLSKFNSFGQKIDDIQQSYNIKQDGLTIRFFVRDKDEKQLKKFNSEHFYFWFKAQKIMKTQGGSSGELLHGSYESHYTNAQLCEKGMFSNGLKNGQWNYWNKDGFLIRTETWREGELKGKQLVYNEKGLVVKKICVDHTSSSLLLNDSTTYFGVINGVIYSIDSIGEVISIERLKNGMLDGKQMNKINNEKVIVSYKKGKQVENKKKSETEQSTTEKESIFQRIRKVFSKKKNPENSSVEKKERKIKLLKRKKQ